MSTTHVATIALAALFVGGTAPSAAPPGPDPEPVLECPDIAGHLTATPSSIDRETSTSLTITLVWSVDVPKRCPESPIVTLERRTVPLLGQLTVGILGTTTFVLRLESEHRDLARATVTVQGDPGFITVSLGRPITAEDIAKFNAQWMQPASIKQALDFATWTLQNRDPDGVWGTGERMAAMVRMFDLTQDTRYLDHLQDLIQVALKYRDDLPLDRDRPDLIRLTDQIRNKVGLAAWGGPEVDYGGLHHVDEIVSSLYAYPIAAFARIVAGHPTLQVRYGCDSLSGKTCRDAIDYTNYVRETVGVFLPQIRRQRVGGFIEAKLTHPVEYRNRPTAADCDKAYEDAKKADPGNLARWDQKHSDCNLLRDLAGQALPHNINLTFSMVLIELSRVLDTPFYLQSPRHSAGAENMRDQILVLISRQQRYLVNHLNPGALKDQYSSCERNFCWYYMDSRTPDHGPHPEDADHGSMDMSYVGLFVRDSARLRAAAARLHEPLPFTDSHPQGFARTFVATLAGGRNLKHDVAGAESDPPDSDNSRCEGWLELTRADASVWQACHAVSLRIVDGRQPYLNIGNHSALLVSKQFLPP